MFILSSKIKLLKEKLKVWNIDVFGNVHNFVKDVEIKLQAIQDQLQANGFREDRSSLEKKAHIKLGEGLHRKH